MPLVGAAQAVEDDISGARIMFVDGVFFKILLPSVVFFIRAKAVQEPPLRTSNVPEGFEIIERIPGDRGKILRHQLFKPVSSLSLFYFIKPERDTIGKKVLFIDKQKRQSPCPENCLPN